MYVVIAAEDQNQSWARDNFLTPCDKSGNVLYSCLCDRLKYKTKFAPPNQNEVLILHFAVVRQVQILWPFVSDCRSRCRACPALIIFKFTFRLNVNTVDVVYLGYRKRPDDEAGGPYRQPSRHDQRLLHLS